MSIGKHVLFEKKRKEKPAISVRSQKERNYFLFLKYVRVERKKVKRMFHLLREEKIKVIKQLMRFNYFLIDVSEPKLTDRLAYLSAQLPDSVDIYVKSKLALLTTVYKIITRFDYGTSLFDFVTEGEKLNILNQLERTNESLLNLIVKLREIKKEYHNKLKIITNTHKSYGSWSAEKKEKLIDEDIKAILKSDNNLKRVTYYFDQSNKLLKKEDNKHFIISFRAFLQNLNIFLIRDHKTLKKIASRIKYIEKLESFQKLLRFFRIRRN